MKKKLAIIYTILLLFGSLSFLLPISNGYSYYGTIIQDFQIQYNVTDWNQTAAWINTTWAVQGYYNTSIGEKVNLTVNSTTGQISFNIEIGNYTRNDSSNLECALSMSLNIFGGFNGGFIIDNLSWAQQKQFVINSGGTILGENANNITFNFSNAFQQTNWTYDLRTGILLNATTVAGNYNISLDILSDLPGIYTPPPTPIPGFEFVFLFVAIIFGVLTYKLVKKDKTIQKEIAIIK